MCWHIEMLYIILEWADINDFVFLKSILVSRTEMWLCVWPQMSSMGLPHIATSLVTIMLIIVEPRAHLIQTGMCIHINMQSRLM